MVRKNESSILYGEVINANRELNILQSLKGYVPPFQILRAFHLVDDGLDEALCCGLLHAGQPPELAAGISGVGRGRILRPC